MSYKQVYDTRACIRRLHRHGIARRAPGSVLHQLHGWCPQSARRMAASRCPVRHPRPDAVRFISNRRACGGVRSAACLPTMLDCLGDCPSVKLLVVYGPAVPPRRRRRRRRGRDARSSRSSSSSTRERRPAAVPPNEHEMATICYVRNDWGPEGGDVDAPELVSSRRVRRRSRPGRGTRTCRTSPWRTSTSA